VIKRWIPYKKQELVARERQGTGNRAEGERVKRGRGVEGEEGNSMKGCGASV
jgi:hypothetical protein